MILTWFHEQRRSSQSATLPPPLPGWEPTPEPPPVPKPPRFSHTESAILALVAIAGLGFLLNLVNAVSSGAITVPSAYNGIVEAAVAPATLLIEALIRQVKQDHPDLPTTIAREADGRCQACRAIGQEHCGH